MSNPVFTTFAQVQNALQTFVTKSNINIAGAPHGNMWERGRTPQTQYTAFTTGNAIGGYPIMIKGNGAQSNIILALSGQAPFDGSVFPQMPAGGPYLDAPTIAAISAWIDAGAPQGAAVHRSAKLAATAAFASFAQVQSALQTYVTKNNIPIADAPHGNMWENGSTPQGQYTNFTTGNAIQGFPIMIIGNSAQSNIILALRGDPPFDGSEFPHMPASGAPPWLDDATIDAIAGWIDAGAPFGASAAHHQAKKR